MILWAVMTIMVAVAASALTIPLVRRRESQAQVGAIDVLKAQLDELDERAAIGTIESGEADALRAEIKRRILREGMPGTEHAVSVAGQARPWLGVALALLIAAAATGLYAVFGNPNVPSAMGTPDRNDSRQASNNSAGEDNLAALVGQLESKMRSHPGDPEGWRLLGWSYLQTGRPAESARAYARAAALVPKNPAYASAEGEALTQAAGGQVSPAARNAFARALAIDPADPRARYFLAAWKDQQGDHAGAIADWLALLKSAPADAPWAMQVRGVVERTARENSVDITGKLASTTPRAGIAGSSREADLPNPTADQIAAASKMSETDRLAMERAMVDRLAAELKLRPQNREGWVRLMRARMVLGEIASAVAAYHDARAAFAGQAGEIAALRAAAKNLHIPGA